MRREQARTTRGRGRAGAPESRSSARGPFSVDNEAEGVRYPGLIAQRPEAHYEESHDLQQRCGVVH